MGFNILKKGSVHLEGSALSGKKGLSAIYGHTAVLGILKRRHIPLIYIFTELANVREGARIVIKRKGEVYMGDVIKRIIISPKRLQSFKKYYDSSRVWLLLITCWPPGYNTKRLVLLATKVN